MNLAVTIAAFIAGAYLSGSIPFGWLIGKARGVDIRLHGSKNIGATNCGRVCGWPWGVMAFLLDVAKGFAPVYAAVLLAPGFMRDHIDPDCGGNKGLWLYITLVAAAPILGHLFPVWLRFKGGKAVATSLGVLLAMPMLWYVALAAFGVWVLAVLATRYVSVASTAAALAMLGMYLYFEREKALDDYAAVTAFVLVVVAMVIWRHRSNYRRLLRGEENRLWGRKNSAKL